MDASGGGLSAICSISEIHSKEGSAWDRKKLVLKYGRIYTDYDPWIFPLR